MLPGQGQSAEGRGTITDKDIANAEVIAETDYYKLIYLNLRYYCFIYDDNHNVAKTEGWLTTKPQLSIVDGYIVKFTLQPGTGIGTQWGYYYDTKADVFSNVFQSIFSEQGGKVAYGGLDKVIVRDIFDKTKYYKEFSTFKQPLAKSADPITDVKFANKGKSIKVTYLTGADLRSVSEVFDLG